MHYLKSCYVPLLGETLYITIMKPTILQEEEKCLAVLDVHGGPHIQVRHGFLTLNYIRHIMHCHCVVNKFYYQLMKIHSMTNAGYVVVNIDNRGSYNRGIDFEFKLTKIK